MNERTMHLYNALLCIAVHPKRFTIMCGGGVSPQPPPVFSIHLDDNGASALIPWMNQFLTESSEPVIQRSILMASLF